MKAFFDNLKWAEGQSVNGIDGKQSNPQATRAYIQTRIKLTEKESELREAESTSTKDEAHISHLQREIKYLKDDQQKLYVTGPQGLSEELMKQKRKEQKKPASVEGFHTFSASRVPNSIVGIAGAEISDPGGKTALHQSLGYATQSIWSGLMRIVTEVPQIRMNKGGKPKLPSNLTAISSFKRNNAALKALRKEDVKAARTTLAATIPTITAEGSDDPAKEALEEIVHALQKVRDAIKSGEQHLGTDENLWILVERELRGKKASAVVSVIAGFASTGAYAVEQTGAAAVAGHKILCLLGSILQMPASYFDYFDGNIDFPQKVSAEKISLELLVTPEALEKIKAGEKTWETLEDEDINTKIATQLYDEQPQLVRDTIRNIALHELGTLNAQRLKLREEIENERHLSLLPSFLRPNMGMNLRRKEKLQQLNKVELELHELQSQFVLFEQHDHEKLDKKGLIGRAIIDPIYFCRKGISANVFNKMGEVLSQVNQRDNNNENPVMSLEMAAIAMDVATNILGSHFVQDAIHSFDGTGPENPAAERAMIAIASMSGFAAVNSGVTVGPARVIKTAHDRKMLGSPAYISNGKGITADDRKTQVQQAFDNGMLSERKKKKLDNVISILTAAESDDASVARPSEADITRMQKKWSKFEQRCDHVNRTIEEIEDLWMLRQRDASGQPLLNHKGNPIVFDLRPTSACHSHYISAWKRTALLAWSVPKSMYESMRFWKDITVSAKEKKNWRKLAADGAIIDPNLKALLDRGDSIIRRYLVSQLDIPLDGVMEVGNFFQEVSTEIARNRAKGMHELTEWEIWKNPEEYLSTHLEQAEFREEVEATCNALEQTVHIDLTKLNQEETSRLINQLQTLAHQVGSMHELISRMTDEAFTAGTSLPDLHKHRRLAGLKSNLAQSLQHIDAIFSATTSSEELQA